MIKKGKDFKILICIIECKLNIENLTTTQLYCRVVNLTLYNNSTTKNKKIDTKSYAQVRIQLVVTNTHTLYIKTPTKNDNRIFIKLML